VCISWTVGGIQPLNTVRPPSHWQNSQTHHPFFSSEAMDRIHRLGQRRPVEAIKLVVEDSIESRIVQLQEKKSAMIDATLSTDDSAMGRLTPEDVRFYPLLPGILVDGASFLSSGSCSGCNSETSLLSPPIYPPCILYVCTCEFIGSNIGALSRLLSASASFGASKTLVEPIAQRQLSSSRRPVRGIAAFDPCDFVPFNQVPPRGGSWSATNRVGR
jgi:hypothetical protein